MCPNCFAQSDVPVYGHHQLVESIPINFAIPCHAQHNGRLNGHFHKVNIMVGGQLRNPNECKFYTNN